MVRGLNPITPLHWGANLNSHQVNEELKSPTVQKTHKHCSTRACVWSRSSKILKHSTRDLCRVCTESELCVEGSVLSSQTVSKSRWIQAANGKILSFINYCQGLPLSVNIRVDNHWITVDSSVRRELYLAFVKWPYYVESTRLGDFRFVHCFFFPSWKSEAHWNMFGLFILSLFYEPCLVLLQSGFLTAW